MKKDWKKSQLIVVVRGSAEENVLNACKITNFTGPSISDGNCTDPNGRCAICEAPGDS
jgi:hypothetical protein